MRVVHIGRAIHLHDQIGEYLTEEAVVEEEVARPKA
jgi:hypothetical protein